MKCILDKNYRLRGWTDSLANLEHFPTRALTKITPEEFVFLSACDGQKELDTNENAAFISRFSAMGAVSETNGEQLLPEQRYLFYNNRRFRKIDLSITGYCDFRCRHCFNAADDKPRNVQHSTEDILSLIERLDECGVAGLRINGGEPLLNRDFLTITDELRKRGMIFHELISNIYHLTPDIADSIKAQGHDPEIYVSFDGLGHHEWLRMKEGSEQRTLDNIKMLKEKGFFVHVHYCVWKDSLDAVRPTMLKLRELGVDRVRITCIEPALRWVKSDNGQTVAPSEWLEFVCGLLEWYNENITNMALDVWCFWQQTGKRVKIIPDGHRTCDMEYRIPTCSDGYMMPFIDCDGRIMLCLGLSGITKAYGIDWGNAYTDDIHALLRDSDFVKQCGCTIGEMKDMNPECRDCEWRRHCQFGCRAEALGQGNPVTGIDRRMCVFFKEGFYGRFLEIADKYGLVYDK